MVFLISITWCKVLGDFLFRSFLTDWDFLIWSFRTDSLQYLSQSFIRLGLFHFIFLLDCSYVLCRFWLGLTSLVLILRPTVINRSVWILRRQNWSIGCNATFGTFFSCLRRWSRFFWKLCDALSLWCPYWLK